MEEVLNGTDEMPEPVEGTGVTPDELPSEPEDANSQASESVEEVILAEALTEPASDFAGSDVLKAIIEGVVYITDEPLTPEQIASALEQPVARVREILAELVAESAAPDRGLSVREIAGGYKLSTKPEHHEAIRRFVKRLQPPLKLSLAALETLAVVAYKQPITGPEILEIRGVQGAGVLKTLLDRKLIATAGRKSVIGKPMMYKTTREFLIQFGLNSLAELPTLREFEELGRLALTDSDETAVEMPAVSAPEQPNLPEEEVSEEPVETSAEEGSSDEEEQT